MKPTPLHPPLHPASHGSLGGYVVGLLLSVMLTFASFGAVMSGIRVPVTVVSHGGGGAQGEGGCAGVAFILWGRGHGRLLPPPPQQGESASASS